MLSCCGWATNSIAFRYYCYGGLMRSITLGLVLCITAASPAFAWGNFGHMEVAALAWDQMTPQARSKAAELLKLNPDYSKWTDGVAAPDQDRIAFVTAATWPDSIKREGGYSPAGGDVAPPGPAAGRNIGYSDKLMHKYWHFVDVPFSPDGTSPKQPRAPNAQTMIGVMRAALSDAGTSDDIRSYDLIWLEHLVGDVHQPLHATSRFTHENPKGDAGGNDVQIHCDTGCKATELHAFWDGIPGPSSAKPSDAIAAAAQLEKPDAEKAEITDEAVWVQESFETAKASVYKAPPIGEGPGPFTLTPAYKSNAEKVAKERMALAGARLANLLNAALK